MPAHSWTAGDYLTHRFNPELGIGRVTAIEGRALVVDFPRSGTRLRLAGDTDALLAIDLGPGRLVRITATREETAVAARLPDARQVFVRIWSSCEALGRLATRFIAGNLPSG